VFENLEQDETKNYCTHINKLNNVFISNNVENFKRQIQLLLNHNLFSINPYVYAEDTYLRNNINYNFVWKIPQFKKYSWMSYNYVSEV
jgi:Holliday junction resolvase RusA-like endonuclease